MLWALDRMLVLLILSGGTVEGYTTLYRRLKSPFTPLIPSLPMLSLNPGMRYSFLEIR